MLRATLVVILLALLACPAWAGGPPTRKGPANALEALTAEIEAMKADTVAWRGIAWKSCLIEGLAESKRKRKPVLLWVFIDRPADDARC